MKIQVPANIERYRITKGKLASDNSYGNNGAFIIPYADQNLKVIISDQGGWDHVSVSLQHRCPTWDELHWIKRIFFEDDETVIQIHPPELEYVNYHPNVLHLWRHQGSEIIRPPRWMIAP